MVIVEKKKTDATLKEISLLYSRLHLLFLDVAKAFTDWSLKKEGIILEGEKSSVDTAKAALVQINLTLTQLKNTEKKFKFDKRVLEEAYRDELGVCQTAVKGMVGALNAVWKFGKPSRREVPFNDTTNYKFILKHLITYMGWANDLSKLINDKTSIFNKANKDLPPLPRIPDNIAAPSWAKNLK